MDVTESGAKLFDRMPTQQNNRPWGRQGKGVAFDDPSMKPSSELDTINMMDNAPVNRDDVASEVEDDTTSDEMVDSDDDTKSVITVSSSPDVPNDAPFGMSERPWKMVGFTTTMRREWETMYSTLQQTPLAGDWDATEAYQREKDREMLMYIQDFPLPSWVIPKQQAEIAYSQVIERMRWRSLGIAIYDQARTAHMAFPHNVNLSMPPVQGYASYRYQSPNVPLDHQQASASQPNLQRHELQPGQAILANSQMMNAQPYSTVPYTAQAPQHSIPPQTMLPHEGYTQSQYPQHSLPNTSSHGYQILPRPGLLGPKQKRAKKEKNPVPSSTPLPPLPPPPYAPRYEPVERRTVIGRGKIRQSRKQAEAEEYPWHRQFDFLEAKDKACWDETAYDQEVLDKMAKTRSENRPLILSLDDEQSGKQRKALIQRPNNFLRVCEANRGIGITRQKKAGRYRVSDREDLLSEGEKGGKDVGQGRKSVSIGDFFHSGKFSFATEMDARKASVTKLGTPDEIIAAAEAGKVDWELCKTIMICWNPGKKGATEQLVQVSFRIYDTLITRKQLEQTKILTRRAAECIIDFCPDLLWRETLLRIVSEGGLGNKDVRDRFCFNGCYADKATITKRIAAALGQKQTQPRAKDVPVDKVEGKSGDSSGQIKEDSSQAGEENYYASNGEDFDKYIRFFGKRQSTRNQAKFAALPSGMKRNVSDGDEFKDETGSKRQKLDQEGLNGSNDDGSEKDVTMGGTAAEEDDEAESAGGSLQNAHGEDTIAA
nr:hypothetical protein CFP56_57608 [Quercus suber]